MRCIIPEKANLKSDDPSVWKNLLIEHSKGALDHLSNVELPAIQKRLDEIEKENIALESKKRKLLEKNKTLQGKVMVFLEEPIAGVTYGRPARPR